MEYFSTNQNLKMPKSLYGTAWKKEKTAELVELALNSGFVGIDTACQPKHYYEPGVGEGLQSFLSKSDVRREDLFIQTKFTPYAGQDPDNLPYHKEDSIKDQIFKSFETSLKNLKVGRVDSLVLHSPYSTWTQTQEAWLALEELFDATQQIGQLGISNCYDLNTLTQLFNESRIKPSVVQNRFYRETNYDRELRQFCKEQGIVNQSFWTLTANDHILGSSKMQGLSAELNRTPAQILYRYLTQNNVCPLIGTTSEVHMKEDLDIFSFQLTKEQMQEIQSLIFTTI